MHLNLLFTFFNESKFSVIIFQLTIMMEANEKGIRMEIIVEKNLKINIWNLFRYSGKLLPKVDGN